MPSRSEEHPDEDLERQPILSGSDRLGSGRISSNGSGSGNVRLYVLKGTNGAPPFTAPRSIPAGAAAWWRQPLVVSTLQNLGLILLWYFFGTFLSLWNKMLLGKDKGLFGNGAFPAPFLMSSVQFFCQHLLAGFLLSTGCVRRRSEDVLTWRQYCRTIVPNGMATALDIGFSNFSLVFITLSFYVMCKSTTPIFLLFFAILWGIEKPSWSLAAVVVVISCGLALLVWGETSFHLGGFALVMTAAMLSGLRWTITQVLLQGDGHHSGINGPVEVLHQLTPVMGATLLLVSLVFEQLWVTLPSSPYFASLGHCILTLGIMLVGGLIAFCMVWAEFTLISNTSALTFMVAGTFKEIVTVGAAVLFLHENFTVVNAFGLLVLVLGVVIFNWIKYQKLKQGELRMAPVDDSLTGSHAHFMSNDLDNMPGGWQGGAPAPKEGLRVEPKGGNGSTVEMSSKHPPRPPSPMGAVTEANQRRVQRTESEEGTPREIYSHTTSTASGLSRQYSN